MPVEPNLKTIVGTVSARLKQKDGLDQHRTRMMGTAMAAADQLRRTGTVSQITAQTLVDDTAIYDALVTAAVGRAA